MPGQELRLEQASLDYQAAFSTYLFSLLQAPATLYETLLTNLQPFGATIDELCFEEGGPGEQGIVCQVDDLDAVVTIRAHRLEVSFSGFDRTDSEVAGKVAEAAWAALIAAQSGVKAAEHTITLDLELSVSGTSYQAILGRYVNIPAAFQPSTEAGIVFYFPADVHAGRKESNLVLNRSGVVEDGLAVQATLAFNEDVSPSESVTRAQQQTAWIMGQLGLQLADED